ncbi:MAG: App1 family protein [Candidatus Promineifilaceae bacterium]
MTSWRQAFTTLGHKADNTFDTLRQSLEDKLGVGRDAYVRTYDWFGTADKLIVRGRALRHNGLRSPDDADGLWDNLLNSYRRFNSDEIRYAKLKVWAGDVVQEVVADDEGYFSAEIPHPTQTPTNGWQQVNVQLIEPFSAEIAQANVRIAPANAQIGIISDVDDTILQTFATNLLKVAQLTFMQNAKMRLAFPGVATFYRALQAGASGDQDNPIFYVSSSPWNLYDLLTDFIKLHDIPAGPLCLRDLGIDEDKFITTGHGSHKIEHIEQILTTYPELPFVLIGDSGQKDPEVYAKIARRFPDRILAIYIRDVTNGERDMAVVGISAEINTPMLLTETTENAAQHALHLHLINQAQFEEVRAAVQKADPSLDEVLNTDG